MTLRDWAWLAVAGATLAVVGSKDIGTVEIPERVTVVVEVSGNMDITPKPVKVDIPGIPPIIVRVEGTPRVTVSVTPSPVLP